MTTCACKFTPAPGVEPWTADYHRAHKAHHVATFPASSATTVANLDLMISFAEQNKIRPLRIRGEKGMI